MCENVTIYRIWNLPLGRSDAVVAVALRLVAEVWSRTDRQNDGRRQSALETVLVGH